jgi:hypothetical protein
MQLFDCRPLCLGPYDIPEIVREREVARPAGGDPSADIRWVSIRALHQAARSYGVSLTDNFGCSPITDVNSPDIICNGGPNPLVKVSKEIISVPIAVMLYSQLD